MIELRVVMPKRVTKPTSEPMESAPASGSNSPMIVKRQHAANQREGNIGKHQREVSPVAENDHE